MNQVGNSYIHDHKEIDSIISQTSYAHSTHNQFKKVNLKCYVGIYLQCEQAFFTQTNFIAIYSN